MGKLNEFSIKTRAFLMAYPWKRIDPVPWSSLEKPISDCRVALVSTAGFVSCDQAPFDEAIKGGDTSFREIPFDIDVSSLIETHRSDSFDHAGINQDPNLGFPINRIRELADQGRIGSVNRRHLSFMGSITAPGRLIRDSGPQATRLLVDDQVDVAILVPVWPMCNQAVCLIAAELERNGVSTVVVQLLRDVAKKVRPPRALFVPFKHGYPLDAPDDPERQRAVLESALRMLEDSNATPPMISDYVIAQG